MRQFLTIAGIIKDIKSKKKIFHEIYFILSRDILIF